jgi:hypothetical protein
VKSGTDNFFDSLGKVLMALFTVFVKFIGVIIIIVAASTLISLFIGLFITGISGFFGSWYTDFFHIVNDTLVPLWLLSVLVFFAIAIPFFFLFILGLKILIDNLKSIGKLAKLTLLGLWIISVLCLITIGVMQTIERSNEGSTMQVEELNFTTGDTLYLAMQSNAHFEKDVIRSGGFNLKYNENDEQVIYSNNIRLIVRSTRDSLASLYVNKKAKGRDYLEAKNRAEAISYNYVFDNNTLKLDGYFLADVNDKYRDQQIELTLYLPVGSYLFAENNTYSFHRNTSRFRDILLNGQEGHYLEILDGKTLCETCSPSKSVSREEYEYHVIDWDDKNWKETWRDGNRIKIDRDGIDINITDEKDSVKVNINRRGVNVRTN